MERELVAMILLSFRCLVTVNVLWLFFTVPWVVLQFLIEVCPGHTHLHFAFYLRKLQKPRLPITDL